MNDELGELEQALETAAERILKPGRAAGHRHLSIRSKTASSSSSWDTRTRSRPKAAACLANHHPPAADLPLDGRRPSCRRSETPQGRVRGLGQTAKVPCAIQARSARPEARAGGVLHCGSGQRRAAGMMRFLNVLVSRPRWSPRRSMSTASNTRRPAPRRACIAKLKRIEIPRARRRSSTLKARHGRDYQPAPNACRPWPTSISDLRPLNHRPRLHTARTVCRTRPIYVDPDPIGSHAGGDGRRPAEPTRPARFVPSRQAARRPCRMRTLLRRRALGNGA